MRLVLNRTNSNMFKRLFSFGCNKEPTVEFNACRLDEIPNKGMKLINKEEKKVLLYREDDKVYATGSKCSHYGAPLAGGFYQDGKVRCPWHGACFNVSTGDIEDFPGFGNIPSYKVTIKDGEVWVEGKENELKTDKLSEKTCPRSNKDKCTVIVGSGGAGYQFAQTLKKECYDGKIVLITSDSSAPYDRTKLSKALDIDISKILLSPEDFYSKNNIDLIIGKTVEKIDTEKKLVECNDSTRFNYDKLFLATGVVPRKLTNPGSELKNIFYLKTHTDANTISKVAIDKNVVIVGGSFIGMEVASFLKDKNLAKSITVISNAEYPLPMLGPDVGALLRKACEDKGVKFLAKKSINRIEGTEQVERVVLEDETVLEADVIIVGIGSVTNVSYLKDSGIQLNKNQRVEVNEKFETNVENVYAGGDMVSFPLPAFEKSSETIEHWQMAQFHGNQAALSMLGKPSPQLTVPFFWSMVFGKPIRFSGFSKYSDDIHVAKGTKDGSYAVYFFENDKAVACCSILLDPLASAFAAAMSNKKVLSKELIKNDPLEWYKKLDSL